MDFNYDKENNRIIGYDYDSLEDPTSYSHCNFEDYLINA